MFVFILNQVTECRTFSRRYLYNTVYQIQTLIAIKTVHKNRISPKTDSAKTQIRVSLKKPSHFERGIIFLTQIRFYLITRQIKRSLKLCSYFTEQQRQSDFVNCYHLFSESKGQPQNKAFIVTILRFFLPTPTGTFSRLFVFLIHFDLKQENALQQHRQGLYSSGKVGSFTPLSASSKSPVSHRRYIRTAYRFLANKP